MLDSTSNYLASIADESPHGFVVEAEAQTAGRGQRGNSWESEPRMNILMSVLLRPEGIAPSEQFLISQAVSVAIVRVLRHYLPEVRIKWPNDIYVGDRKICGILIENSITATKIIHSIVGIGLNVNQREFHSDAPNPVSMFQLTGRNRCTSLLAREVVREILREVESLRPPPPREPRAELFLIALEGRRILSLHRQSSRRAHHGPH